MLTPQQNPYLTGHDNQLTVLKQAFDADHLPHSLIINGPAGIGKATFAFHFIRYILGGEDPESPVFKKIAAGSHPNVLNIIPEFDEKKQRLKSILTVNEAHKVVPFFQQTSVDNGWRFALVDQAHTMNRNAQNAILKILEEPPAQSTIFLISENSGAFLPTIRSRCQILHLFPLTEGEVADELEDRYPELTQADIDVYARLSRGSLGLAFELIDMDALTITADIDQAGLDMTHSKEKTLLNFCEEYGHNAKDREYSFIKQFLPNEIEYILRAKINNKTVSLSQWQTHLFKTKTANELVNIHDKVQSVFEAGDVSFLDRKLVLLNALQAMR